MADTVPIQRFLTRVRQASASGARDIRLTIGEATELTASLAALILEHAAAPRPPTVMVAARTDDGKGLDGGSL